MLGCVEGNLSEKFVAKICAVMCQIDIKLVGLGF